MSNSAYRFAKKEIVEEEFDFNNLNELRAIARAEVEENKQGEVHTDKVRVSLAGLFALFEGPAVALWGTRDAVRWHVGGITPRVSTLTPWYATAYRGKVFLPKEEATRLIEHAARLGGWLRVTPEHRALCAVARQMTRLSRNGRLHGAAKYEEWAMKMAHAGLSPHRANAWLNKVHWRAVEILSAYAEAPRTTWLMVARAMMVTTKTGKAAVVAAALTLRGGTASFKSYKEARDWLSILHRCKNVAETAEGLVRYNPVAVREEAGAAVYTAVRPISQRGRITEHRNGYLVVRGKETYFSTRTRPELAAEEALRFWSFEAGIERAYGLREGNVVVSDGDVVIQHNLQYLRGCAHFPDGVTHGAVVLGEHHISETEGSRYFRMEDCSPFRRFTGWVEVVQGGNIVFVTSTYKTGPVDTARRLDRVVIRSHIRKDTAIEMIKNALEGRERYKFPALKGKIGD